jgi:tripeptide aminopeptidase
MATHVAQQAGGTVVYEVKDQYYNMFEILQSKRKIIQIAQKAMEKVDVKPIIKPIRGGTDGARLSFMGLPCPNLFAGGINFHGRQEFLPVPSLEKSRDVVIEIIKSIL